MGINLAVAKMLMEVGRDQPFSGAALQLGRQDIEFDETALETAAAEVGYCLQPAAAGQGGGGPVAAEQGDNVSDVVFLSRLGFQSVLSLDFSLFEGAPIIFDLNFPSVPAEYAQFFDLIIDGGTLEHIFRLPNALNNIFQFLKPGGSIAHVSPSHNYFEHGFYCFNPTFFL